MRRAPLPHSVADLNPAPSAVPGILACLKSLNKLSNLCGLLLLAQQGIAVVSTVSAMIVYYFTLIVLERRNPAGISPDFLSGSNSVLSNLLTCLIYFSYMFLPFILMVFVLKQHPFHIVPVRRIRNKRLLLPVLAVVLSFSFLADLLTQYIGLFLSFLNLQPTSPDFTPPSSPAAFLLYFFQICILAPICEEFLFRGVILQNLRRFGNSFAVILSALLFSLVHGNLEQIPLAFLVGIVFGVLCIEFNSIWVTVLMHFSVNFVSTVVSTLSAAGYDIAANVLYYSIMLPCVGITVVLFIRLFQSQAVRDKIASYRKSALPIRFLFKRFFLSPCMILFVLLTGLYVALYTKIL